MINLKCLNTSEPCRTAHANLRMAVSTGEACGVLAGSVFLYPCLMSDKVQGRDCKHRAQSWGPEAKSQVCCVLAAYTGPDTFVP